MISRTAILADRDARGRGGVDWQQLGTVVEEVSELYQLAKERTLDLIIVGQHRTDLKAPVATRIRRYNGLTEIWKVVASDLEVTPEPDYIDGLIPLDLGHKGISLKVAHILRTKELLSQYRFVGRSQKMKAVAETIERIAPTDVAVLIVGPSGSGKELVARAIHRHSGRADRPYVAINCGAIAEGILESELFGHEKGAFTGSVAKRDGLFHKADGGTIFLDEIGETRPEMQVKLLRVLEDGTYYPVGSSVPKTTDVRLISATNRDLTEAIEERQFREDLYFRIGVVKLILPPLLERKEDIQPLLHHFWARDSKLSYTDSALELLTRYDWPGNVRQLKNFADRMTALKKEGLVDENDIRRFIEEQHVTASNLPVSTGKTVEEAGQELIYRAIISLGNEVRLLRDLITAHLPAESGEMAHPEESLRVVRGMTVEQMEAKLVEQALAESGGNRKEAARKLGIGERTLYRKLKKYSLS
ncbi:MAG: sigma-54 dependent transcriptional regulator [candidate division Zixibacteria bacterium]|nr:sigma-54 dependent transcriptional regulator [candidate division Zixibacteria bacterium]